MDLFGMDKAKFVSTPISKYFKLTSFKENDYEEESKYMKGVPYSYGVGSIMYDVRICLKFLFNINSFF